MLERFTTHLWHKWEEYCSNSCNAILCDKNRAIGPSAFCDACQSLKIKVYSRIKYTEILTECARPIDDKCNEKRTEGEGYCGRTGHDTTENSRCNLADVGEGQGSKSSSGKTTVGEITLVEGFIGIL